MHKTVILALLVISAAIFAQTTISPWVVDNGGGMRSPAAGDTVWASIGQGVVSGGCVGGCAVNICAGYLYLFPTACLEVLETKSIPKVVAINSLYPNPFNSACVVEFEISERSDISIDLLDLQGRKVANLLSQKDAEPKAYRLRWTADELPSGTYFVQLNAGNNVIIKRAILMK